MIFIPAHIPISVNGDYTLVSKSTDYHLDIYLSSNVPKIVSTFVQIKSGPEIFVFKKQDASMGSVRTLDLTIVPEYFRKS